MSEYAPKFHENQEREHAEPSKLEKNKTVLEKLRAFARKHPAIYSSILLAGSLASSAEAFAADTKTETKTAHAEKIETASDIDTETYEREALKYLEGKITRATIVRLQFEEDFDDNERARRINESKQEHPVKIAGFDRGTKLGTKDIVEMLKSLPAGTQANLREINRASENSSSDVNGEEEKDWIVNARTDRNKKIMTVYPAMESFDRSYYYHTLFHELAHLNDWTFNEFLTKKEKLILILAVIKRLEDKDRFRAPEVEKMQNKDPKMKFEKQCEEYLSEIFANTMQPGKFVDKKDELIVKWLLHKMDPQYNKAKLFDIEKKIIFVPDNKEQLASVIRNE